VHSSISGEIQVEQVGKHLLTISVDGHLKKLEARLVHVLSMLRYLELEHDRQKVDFPSHVTQLLSQFWQLVLAWSKYWPGIHFVHVFKFEAGH
jgi:hypothetical protein